MKYFRKENKHRMLMLFALACLISIMCGSLGDPAWQASAQSRAQWEPHQVSPEQADVRIWTSGNTTYAGVTLTFPSAGYRVVDWGRVERASNNITVDIKAERWTGASILVITKLEKVYELGTLAPGAYTFTLRSRGTVVKTQQFDSRSTLEQWVQVAPTSDQVSIAVRTSGGITFASVSLLFPDNGYRVVDWGQVTMNGNSLAVDIKVERWTGRVDVGTRPIGRIYELGRLADGTYSLAVRSNGATVKSQQFTPSAGTPPGDGGLPRPLPPSSGGTPGPTVPPVLASNPIDDPLFLVRQHYLDFLNRTPEEEGLNNWIAVLDRCGNDQECLNRERIEVSAAFFRSEEFGMKGYFVYRFYAATLGRTPKYDEFMADLQRVTGQTADDVQAKREAFAAEWVERAEFKARYDGLPNAAFVDGLLNTAGVHLAGRNELVADLDDGRKTRAQVVRAAVESQQVYDKEYNQAFVAMQYFGYLRRDPEDQGYQDWLRVINSNPQDYKTMVHGFVTSVEYRQRFSHSSETTTKADIRGAVTRLSPADSQARQRGILGNMLIEGAKEQDTHYDKASVTINEQTQIFIQEGQQRRRAAFDELKIGQRVEARFTGPVLLSYPVQAGASEIVILK